MLVTEAVTVPRLKMMTSTVPEESPLARNTYSQTHRHVRYRFSTVELALETKMRDHALAILVQATEPNLLIGNLKEFHVVFVFEVVYALFILFYRFQKSM